jgi:predicted nucleotidyltransferase
MTELDLLAAELGTSGRTLRRAANRGAIRCTRPSDRRIVVSPREYGYVRRQWPLFGRLLEELRTQPNMRLAVVFGSVARGEENVAGDLDLLVRLRRDGFRERADLTRRLQAVSGRRVQLVGLGEAEHAPLLLRDVLRDGRVLVDRDGDWRKLTRRERAIGEQAADAERRLDEEAWTVLEDLDAG